MRRCRSASRRSTQCAPTWRSNPPGRAVPVPGRRGLFHFHPRSVSHADPPRLLLRHRRQPRRCRARPGPGPRAGAGSRPRRPEAAHPPRPDRLRRARRVDRRPREAGRRLRARRGRGLFSRPRAGVRQALRRAREPAVHGALRLQAADRERRVRGRRDREPAVLPRVTGGGRDRRGAARVPREAGRGRRAGLPAGRGGGPQGDGGEEVPAGRLPEPRERFLHRGDEQGARRRAGHDGVRRGDVPRRLSVRRAPGRAARRAERSRGAPARVGAGPGAVRRHHHRAVRPHLRHGRLGHRPRAGRGVRRRRAAGARGAGHVLGPLRRAGEVHRRRGGQLQRAAVPRPRQPARGHPRPRLGLEGRAGGGVRRAGADSRRRVLPRRLDRLDL